VIISPLSPALVRVESLAELTRCLSLCQPAAQHRRDAVQQVVTEIGHGVNLVGGADDGGEELGGGRLSPSAVPLVSDVRFRRSAQRLASIRRSVAFFRAG
jgi:hypothetical protein